MPQPRFVVAGFVVMAFLAMLLIEGYVHSGIGRDSRIHPPVSADGVPDAVLNGGPVIDTTHGRMHSYRLPDKTIALSFDDGPDPTWTPQILDVLRQYHVPATFFVIGELVARHPELVRRELAQGHEVGVHTFSHPDLEYQPAWRRDLELSQSQLALAGAAGINSSLMRPPYSSEPSALDDLSWPLVQEMGAKGYITTFVDLDTEDWARPGVRSMMRNATPKNGRGAMVLLHDAGGDRAQTVAALKQYIPAMRAKGYRFATVTGALHAPSAVHPAATGQKWRGKAFVWAVGLSDQVVPALLWLLLVAGALVLARLVLMLVLARRHARIRKIPGPRRGPPVTEPVTVVVPAYNERECISNTVRSLVASDHPLEVIVVDDGSTDGTADIVEALGLPDVTVVRQGNSGKATALNNGVDHARHDLIVMMDGDTVFAPDTIRHLVQPFADPAVGAVAGNAKVGNKSRLIGKWQHIEYVIGFNLDRRMYDLLRCMPTVPGAVGGFRRQALKEVGGMSDDTLAEDTDITMALQRAGWRVVYEQTARAWTEAPSSLGQLWRQRYRWSYGTMQAMWKHRHALVERGPSGRFGRVGLPLVALFQVLLPLLAPLIDILTVYGLLFMDPVKTAIAWLAVLAVQALCAVYAFRLDRERLLPLLTLPLQQVVYRQLMYLVLIQSVITALAGGRLRWQKLDRTGEVPTNQASVPV